MADEIVWEEPPAPNAGKGKRGVWMERLAPLRERPGEWANLGQRSNAIVTSINRGRLEGVERGDFEAVGRDQTKQGKCTLYVRYIGKPNLKAASGG